MIHVPSPMWPYGPLPEGTVVWESRPTTFELAARAWAAAASAVAMPLYPPQFAALASEHYFGEREPFAAQLRELDEEAYRRAVWLPGGARHSVCPAAPEMWVHDTQFGLCWHSSVQTILARTWAGWIVRLVGKHAQRQEAAEAVLGVGLTTPPYEVALGLEEDAW